jgi:hypothetical protein
MRTYTNTLELNHKHKPIPYGGTGELREDGEANYGFKYVKGNEQLLQEIPELKRDEALLLLVKAINSERTGLFSVGCVSEAIQDDQGFRHSGYVEFTFNSVSAIADARSYFSVFFHFDRVLHEQAFPVAVMFSWELQPATFTEAGASGYTCAVIMNTHYSQSSEAAQLAWFTALSVLGEYLASVPPETKDYLYKR